MSVSTEAYTRELVLDQVKKGESLEGQKLKGIDLSNADLRHAKFRGAQFRYSDLRGADLRNADLREANLRHVNLVNANLTDADLRGADLAHADIRGASFTSTRVATAKFGDTRGLSTKVFFPQALLDRMVGDGSAMLSGEELLVPKRGERWKMIPAARVLGLEAGTDAKSILFKLIPEVELKAKGLEIYRDTALVAEGDTVYKLDPGMIGEPLHEVRLPEAPAESMAPEAAKPAAAMAAKVPDAGKPKTPEEQKKSDQELINDFLLKRLST